MEKILIILFVVVIVVIACQPKSEKETPDANVKTVLTEADVLVKQAIIAHGGELYDNAHFQFVFREKQYTFQNSDEGYTYTVRFNKDGQEIFDQLSNETFTRTIDDVAQQLSSKEISRYKESLNSVIYFGTLPHKLSDPAVNLQLVGQTSIKDNTYDVLQVTFDEEGGGKDHDDQFHYWINKADHTIDYLAYNYKTNKGGVRFRSAYNRRNVGGIIFQDYINYKAEVGTPLFELPALFEDGKLEELSRIETEAVIEVR